MRTHEQPEFKQNTLRYTGILFLLLLLLLFFFFFFNFYNCVAPMGFLPWEIQVAFSLGKPAATESRYPTFGACWVLQSFHNPPNSEMDYRVLNVRTDVDAGDCTRGCADTVKELS